LEISSLWAASDTEFAHRFQEYKTNHVEKIFKITMFFSFFNLQASLFSRLRNLFVFFTYTIYNQYLWTTNYITLNTHYNYILIYSIIKKHILIEQFFIGACCHAGSLKYV
jgi:hypothetical protein